MPSPRTTNDFLMTHSPSFCTFPRSNTEKQICVQNKGPKHGGGSGLLSSQGPGRLGQEELKFKAILGQLADAAAAVATIAAAQHQPAKVKKSFGADGPTVPSNAPVDAEICSQWLNTMLHPLVLTLISQAQSPLRQC